MPVIYLVEIKGKLWQAQNFTVSNGLTTVTTFLFTVCPTEALWTAAVVTRQQVLEVVREEVGTKIKVGMAEMFHLFFSLHKSVSL